MFLNFKKLYMIISLKIIFSCFFYSNENVASSSRDPLSFPSTSSSSAPAPVEGQDPRMHVTSVQLVEGEDVSWFNEIKAHVKAGYDHLRTTHNYESLKVNTACARFGFLIQEEGKSPVLLFPDHPINDPRLCFTSKFKKHDAVDKFEFYSLKDSFEQPEAFQKALTNVVSSIIEFNLSDITILQDQIRHWERSRQKEEQWAGVYQKIMDGAEGNSRKAARAIQQKLGIVLESKLPEERLFIRDHPFDWIASTILSCQRSAKLFENHIFHAKRILLCQTAKEWKKRFFHSEQASHFYFWKQFNTPGKLAEFLEKIFPDNFEGTTIVDVVFDVCTHLSMCINCAFSYHFENIVKIHYLGYIVHYLKEKKKLKTESRLLTRVSSLLMYEGDPLSPDPIDGWDQTKIGHLSPSKQ